MRIVHITDCYLPRTGGIETQVRSLAMQQRDAGHDVTIITATPGHEGVWSGLDIVDGLPVHRIAANLPGEMPVHPRGGRLIAEALHRLRHDAPVDAVHVHSGVVSPFAWQGIRVATRQHLPTLVTVHCVWGPGAQPAYRLANATTRWSRWGAQVAAVSDMAAERIRPVVAPAQVLVLPNGIHPDQWPVVAHVDEPGTLRVVSVMRLAPRKRTVPLVKVLARAQRELAPDVRLHAVIIGDGPQRGAAQRVARTENVDVEFVGRRDRAGILEAFASSDVFVQPSVKESFGLAALEARTTGLPIVARSQTGIREFVRDGVEGLLCEDDTGLARALVRLGRDPDLLARIRLHNQGTRPQQEWAGVLALTDAAYMRAAEVAHERA